MKQLLNKLLVLWKQLLSYIPEALPVGMTKFETWAEDILRLANIEADADSLKFALATMILHAENKAKYLSKNYFVVRLHKGAANQVASQVFQDIKNKQQAVQAAQQAKTVEDTTVPTGMVDGKPN